MNYLTDIELPMEMWDDAVLMERVDTQMTRLSRALERCTTDCVKNWLLKHQHKKEFDTKRSMITHLGILRQWVDGQECPDRSEQKVIVLTDQLLNIINDEPLVSGQGVWSGGEEVPF